MKMFFGVTGYIRGREGDLKVGYKFKFETTENAAKMSWFRINSALSKRKLPEVYDIKTRAKCWRETEACRQNKIDV